jgi:hypothetical protein
MLDADDSCAGDGYGGSRDEDGGDDDGVRDDGSGSYYGGGVEVDGLQDEGHSMTDFHATTHDAQGHRRSSPTTAAQPATPAASRAVTGKHLLPHIVPSFDFLSSKESATTRGHRVSN